MRFTEADRSFMESLNNTGVVASNIYFTAKHAGYMRNLDRDKVKGLEAIYKRVFDLPKFTLCYHCGNDVMKLVLRLYDALEKQPTPIADPELTLQPVDPVISEPKKKERK